MIRLFKILITYLKGNIQQVTVFEGGPKRTKATKVFYAIYYQDEEFLSHCWDLYYPNLLTGRRVLIGASAHHSENKIVTWRITVRPLFVKKLKELMAKDSTIPTL